MFCVHLIAFFTLGTGLGSRTRAVASTGFVAGRAEQLTGILETLIEATGALITFFSIIFTATTLNLVSLID